MPALPLLVAESSKTYILCILYKDANIIFISCKQAESGLKKNLAVSKVLKIFNVFLS